jgi:hypothetical protein
MKDDDFPTTGDFDENELPSDAARKEQDEQDRLFQEKLKRMSDEAESNAEAKQSTFDFSDDASEDEPFKPELAGDVQNPKESYDLYYAIRRLLMQGLPSGEQNKELRQFVYDEKNLYLRQGVSRPKDGGIVGADSRQSRLQFLREAYAATQLWATRGGSANDIFLDYYDLNKSMRFR